jgi:hypothetical protein
MKQGYRLTPLKEKQKACLPMALANPHAGDCRFVKTRVDVDENQEIVMSSFPYVHLLALMAGGFIVFMVNRKYNKITGTEIILILVLYASLVILFTEPVVNLIKRLLS